MQKQQNVSDALPSFSEEELTRNLSLYFGKDESQESDGFGQLKKGLFGDAAMNS